MKCDNKWSVTKYKYEKDYMWPKVMFIVVKSDQLPYFADYLLDAISTLYFTDKWVGGQEQLQDHNLYILFLGHTKHAIFNRSYLTGLANKTQCFIEWPQSRNLFS